MSADPQSRAPFSTSRAMKSRFRVRLDTGEEHVEADEVEITASGVLAFYRLASRTENERTLLTAFSPELWRRCQLESDG